MIVSFRNPDNFCNYCNFSAVVVISTQPLGIPTTPPDSLAHAAGVRVQT